MKRSIHTIVRLVLVFIPVMLALVQARGQADTVCVGDISSWAVQEVPGDTYTWELYNDVAGLNLAAEPGNCPPAEAYFVDGITTGDSVNVMCLTPGTYFIKVTAVNECPTDNLKLGKIVVEHCTSYAVFSEPDSICPGDPATLTLVIGGGAGPWDVTFTNGIQSWTIGGITSSPYSFPLVPTPSVPGNYLYWVTEVVNGAGLINSEPSEPVTLTVKPKPSTSPIYRYEPVSKK